MSVDGEGSAQERNIRDAYVPHPGRRVMEFTRSNLHVVGYNVPLRTRMGLAALRGAPAYAARPARPCSVPHQPLQGTWDSACRTVNASGMRWRSNAMHLTNFECDGSAHAGCQPACSLSWKEQWLARSSPQSQDASSAYGLLACRRQGGTAWAPDRCPSCHWPTLIRRFSKPIPAARAGGAALL